MPRAFHTELSLSEGDFNDVFRNEVFKKAVVGFSQNRKVSAAFITTLQRCVGPERAKAFPSALHLNIEFKKFLQGRERARSYWQKGWF